MALLQVGTAAPPFKGQNLVGPEFDLESLRGKKSVLLIFAPDQVSPPQLNAVKSVCEKFKAKLEVVSFSRNAAMSPKMITAFLQQFQVKFPVVYDPKQEIYKAYGVEKPVVMYLLDPNLTILNVAQVDPKAINAAQLEAALAALP
jgi:peroxiredoxin